MDLNSHKKLNISQWSEHADAYLTSTVHAYGASLKRLIDLSNPEPSWAVLDTSTGVGHTALAFSAWVRRVVATDLTYNMLSISNGLLADRRALNVVLATADTEALPFGSNEFDLVTSRLGLHHFFNPRLAIEEMTRVLRPGGALALVDNVLPNDDQISTYVNTFDKLRDPSHNWCFSLLDLQEFFSGAGLKLEHHEVREKKLEFEDWVKRMGCTSATREHLLSLLYHAPQQIQDFLNPQFENDRLIFSFQEAILIAKKPN